MNKSVYVSLALMSPTAERPKIPDMSRPTGPSNRVVSDIHARFACQIKVPVTVLCNSNRCNASRSYSLSHIVRCLRLRAVVQSVGYI